MADAALVSWVGRGPEAGFYVANLEERVAGTVAYQRKGEGELEVFRLSVDVGVRGMRVAGHLVDQVIRRARELGCGRVILETSSHQEAAVRFYTRTGWTEEARTFPSAGHFFHGFEVILFTMEVQKML